MVNNTSKKKQEKKPQSINAGPIPVEIDLTATEAAWRKYEIRARQLSLAIVSSARLDVTIAASIATMGARNVLDQRAELSKHFQNPPFEVFERVEDLALAAQHADLLHRAAQDVSAPFFDLLPRVNELRGCFLDDLEVQVRRKRVPAKVLADIRAGDNTVRDKANDLNDAAVYYRTHWDFLSKKTTIEPSEIVEASELAAKVLARLGAQVVARAAQEEEISTVEMRRRAFTLLELDYEVVRHYGAFLFWNLPGGWEQYVPSLWSGRASGDAKPAVVTPPVDPQPVNNG
jgi:hypothetical protein